MSEHVRTRQITIKGRQAKTACLATATWCWMKVCSHCTASHGNWNRGPAIYPGNPCSRSLSEHTRFRNKCASFQEVPQNQKDVLSTVVEYGRIGMIVCMFGLICRVITSHHKSLSFVIIFCRLFIFGEAPQAKLLCLYMSRRFQTTTVVCFVLCRLVLGLKRGTISLGEAMKHLRDPEGFAAQLSNLSKSVEYRWVMLSLRNQWPQVAAFGDFNFHPQKQPLW